MSKVTRIETLHNGIPPHDKVYLLAIVTEDSGETALVTAYGPRGKPLNERRLYPAHPYSECTKIMQQKQAKGYRTVNWRDPNYGMRSYVLKLGTIAGEQEPLIQKPKPLVQKPVVQPAAVRPAVTPPKPTVKKEDAPLGRSAAAPRSFF